MEVELLLRLIEADSIIRNALALMTAEQKAKLEAMNDEQNIAGAGAARANLRFNTLARYCEMVEG